MKTNDARTGVGEGRQDLSFFLPLALPLPMHTMGNLAKRPAELLELGRGRRSARGAGSSPAQSPGSGSQYAGFNPLLDQ